MVDAPTPVTGEAAPALQPGRPGDVPGLPTGRAVGPWAAFLALLGVLVAYLLIAMGCGVAYALWFGPRRAADAPLATAAVVMTMTPLVALAALAVVAVVSRAPWGPGLRRQCGFYLPPRKTALGWLAAMAALIVGFEALFHFLDVPTPEWIIEVFGAVPGFAVPLFVFAIAVCAPFWEELIFRGFLYTSWTAPWDGRRCPPPPPGAAPAPAPALDAPAGDAAAAPVTPLRLPAFICGILVPTAVWAGLHYGQYHGLVLVQVFVMGLFLAACRRRTNSLWLCILLHAANNAFSCWQYL